MSPQATQSSFRRSFFGTYLRTATLMAAIGIGASWMPALRASRIDPAVAIRRQ